MKQLYRPIRIWGKLFYSSFNVFFQIRLSLDFKITIHTTGMGVLIYCTFHIQTKYIFGYNVL